MKILQSITAGLLLSVSVFAAGNTYSTRNGVIKFSSQASLETIEATNNTVASAIDASSGDVAFSVNIKGFHFDKALMEEHFNQQYLESDKFPKSTFKGKITNLAAVNFKKDGTYKVDVKGDLELHGVKQTKQLSADLIVKGEKLVLNYTMPVTLADHQIVIPGAVRDKVAKQVMITLNMDYMLKK
jgi:hypothetical protein